ncbi:alpha-amylase family glycosyl hydrolase [Ornithinimicrobium flavum]|uniref:alpha-amylase family glycosyl hydrolase n=1 Tax=Ornithinimicrobium flavum TaxID=1288636 RepID=UPI00106F1EFA|nr:alpha-amylase family glycosyl hydrolase [Ornithinimicrobium flavum]
MPDTSTIWWHVYPLGATGAPLRRREGADGPRLLRLVPWLDHVVELGCDGLLLGPVFASTSHGYDTLDHHTLDPRLGDDANWDRFVQQAKDRGLQIMLDGVFNHVGIDHPLVQGGPTRPWEGHGDLAELDHDDPAVADLVTDVMLHWLRRGADGWRLDVAYAVPSEFWAEVLGRVRQEFPDALFLGEVIHGDYPAIARAGTLDTVTQYELWKGIWSSLADRNLWELAWGLERHDEFSQEVPMQTFVGNHDVTRIASAVGDAGAALAAVVLMTVPGIPSVYYGDELAFRGEKGTSWGADTPLRPALPGTPAEIGLGWEMFAHHRELIALRRRHPWLTRGRVSVVDRANEQLTYEVAGTDTDGARHVLRVHLDLATSSFRVEVDGTTVLERSG